MKITAYMNFKNYISLICELDPSLQNYSTHLQTWTEV